MRTWFIDDYAVLYLLHVNGFRHEQLRPSWYNTDLPIEDRGRYELPGGFVIEAIYSVELRATRKEQSKR